MPENIVLKVNNLRKHYGSIHAVDDLSFEVERASVFGILGPNGSGKTTTLGMLVEALIPYSGSFEWFGKQTDSAVRKRVGVLLEKPNFYDYLSAVDNLKIVAQIRGCGYNEIEKVLKDVSLYDRRNSRFKTYSLGMKQRLAIASVLLGNPEVLILDEPTNGLDPYGIAEVRNLIREIAAGGKTIILASHLLDEVQKVCTHVLVMKKGKKILLDSVQHISGTINRLELDASDRTKLKEVVLTHPNVNSIVEDDKYVVVDIEPNTKADSINEYLMKYEVKLTHLSFSAFNLEKQILDLLDHS